ncbi:hypothetical protein HMPREF9103_02019, partial [Lentilactobacillus parafarraginis F0439]
KEQFPTEDSLDRFLVSQFNVYNEKSLKRIQRVQRTPGHLGSIIYLS